MIGRYLVCLIEGLRLVPGIHFVVFVLADSISVGKAA